MLRTISAIPYIGGLAEAQILCFGIPTYIEDYMDRVADHLTIWNTNILLRTISAIPYIGALFEAQILAFGIPTYREEYMYRVADHLTVIKYKHIVTKYPSHPLYGWPFRSTNFVVVEVNICYAYPINRPIQLLCFK